MNQSGKNLKALIKFADYLGVDKVYITGGAEKISHSKLSAHYKNLAIDVSMSGNPGLTSSMVANAAIEAGYTHGHLEVFKSNPARNHWHLQISATNYSFGLGYQHRLYKDSMSIVIKK